MIKLFNICFSEGNVPEDIFISQWLICILSPLKIAQLDNFV